MLREAPLLSGLRISLDGTTDFNDISSLKVYATQTPFLNGDIKAYSLLLAEACFGRKQSRYSFFFGFHAIEGGKLSVTDRRFNSNADLPNKIDLVARHSDDNGASWSDTKTIAGNYNQGPDYGYGDAAIVETESGKVVCLMAADRRFQRSTYADRIKVYQTSSNDGGETWEQPHEISDAIYDAVYKDAPSKLQGVFVTSGKGLCLKHQKRKSLNGRILFVMVCKFTDGPYCNYIVYSDDEGKTWPYKYVFNSLPGAYSTIVKCEDGSIGIYYEDGTMSDHYSMNFISMPLEWILR